MRALARAEAERLFAPELVCEQISRALELVVDGGRLDEASSQLAPDPGIDEISRSAR